MQGGSWGESTGDPRLHWISRHRGQPHSVRVRGMVGDRDVDQSPHRRIGANPACRNPLSVRRPRPFPTAREADLSPPAAPGFAHTFDPDNSTPNREHATVDAGPARA